ncbi:MAG: response regulator [Desulfuromonadaceae bacterium]
MIHQIPRILCVDDEPMNLNLLEAMLTAQNFETIRATNGREALEIVRLQPIDVVLLDLMMPGMNGFEVCRRIKADNASRHIPVIMITSHGARENRIRGIESGAEDFLSKPFDTVEVMARVNMLLRVKSLNDQLNSAYSNITNLITFGEGIINTFDPLQFDFIQTVTGIVSQIIAKTSATADKPQLVLAHIPEDLAGGGWFCFGYNEDTALSMIPVSSDIGDDLPIPEQGETVAFFNDYDLLNPGIATFVQRLSEMVAVPNNLVYHLSHRLSLCALNYGRRVTSYDAEVLNSVVAQGLFLQSLAKQVQHTEDAFAYTVRALARASEFNDEDTGNHILRVGHYCTLLAKRLRLSEQFVDLIQWQAMTHDIGKIQTPAVILKKPGKLEPDEFEIIKQHTIYGARILGDHIRLTLARSIALTHHERYDGSGYPHGLKGEQIPIEGRIISLADQYDALRNPRVYKPAFDHDSTVKILTEGDDRTRPEHFDPQVLTAFKNLAPQFEDVYDRLRDNLN